MIPTGAIDCHAHVLGPQARFPYPSARPYTPREARVEDYRAMLDRLGFQRAVLIQPSIYGTDNTCLLTACRELGLETRAVAVLAPPYDAGYLRDLHAAGVRGVRLNHEALEADAIRRLAAAIAPFGWHLQLFVDAPQVEALLPLLTELPVETIFDHLGHVPASAGVGEPAFQALLKALEQGRCWVKLTAPYRLSAARPRFADVAPMVRALYAAAPDRCVWGTDWPHTNTDWAPDTPSLLDLLLEWLPDLQAAGQVLVDNPERLYGFRSVGIRPPGAGARR